MSARLDDFIEAEKGSMSRLDRVFRNYPVVETTRSLSMPAPASGLGQKKIFSPSALLRMQAVVILFFLGIGWLWLLSTLIQGLFPWAVFLFGFLLISFLIVLLVRNYFIVKKYNYIICVTPSGIAIDETPFLWSDITETCILSRHEGRHTNYYLVLFQKDGTVKKLDLFLFAINSVKLATVIEYFKGQATA